MASRARPKAGTLDEAHQPPRSPVSLFSYSPGLILLAIAIADAWRFADPDLWGHVRFGQDALAAGHIIWRDRYSYTAPGHVWLNHEWLSEIVMAALYNRLGVFGLKLIKLACAAVTIVFLAAAEAETGAPPAIQAGVLIVSAMALNWQVQYRPQIFTIALASALLYLLARDAYRRPPPSAQASRLWLAVPMLALWANLHGGFIIGIAALWIYAVVRGTQEIYAGRGRAQILRLGLLAAVSTMATLATPYGFGTWTSVIHALRDPYTRLFVFDWQPMPAELIRDVRLLSPNLLYYALAIALMAALAVSFLLAPTREDLPMVAIAAVMSAGAFMAIRNISIAEIAIAAPLAFHLPLAITRRWPSLGAPSTTGSGQALKGAHAARRRATPLLAAAAIFICWRYDLFSDRLRAFDVYPVGACKFISEHHLKGNILAEFSWGEYAIWKLAPDSKVFIDGRYDTVYPLEAVRDFITFNYDYAGGDAAIAKYPTDFVLIKSESWAKRLMDSRHDWRLIYGDPFTLLYARADSPAARIPGVPASGVAYAVTFP
jgi:hypothetical protein